MHTDPMHFLQSLLHMPKLKRELKEIYAHRMLENFGMAMIGIFIPVYLLVQNFTVSEVLLYITISLTMLAFFSPFSAVIISRFGIRNTLITRPFALVVFIGLVLNLSSFPFLLIPLALVSGIFSSLYWNTIHIIMLRGMDSGHRSEELGYATIVSALSGIIGPLAGGLLILWLGFEVMFGIASVIFLLSLIPLLHVKDLDFEYKLNFDLVFTKEHIRPAFGLIAAGVWAGSFALLPIFVYLMFDNPLLLGSVHALLALGIVIATLVVGKLADSSLVKSKLTIVKAAVPFFSLAWLLLAFITNSTEVAILYASLGILNTFVHTPFTAYVFDLADKENMIDVILLRELCLGTGRLIVLLPAFFLVNTLGATFLLTSVGVWLYWLV